VVDEAKEAGIDISSSSPGRNKGVIEDHFDRDVRARRHACRARQEDRDGDFGARSARGGRHEFHAAGRRRTALATRCGAPATSSATSRSRWLLPDELVLNTPGCLKQMIDAAGKLGDKSNLIAVEEVPAHLTHQYGICGVGKRHKHASMFEIDGMVEKPPKGTAPSNLSITGRYILQPEIFKILETQERGAGGEIPAHRCDDRARQDPKLLRRRIRGRAARLRLQGRFPPRQYRLRDGAAPIYATTCARR